MERYYRINCTVDNADSLTLGEPDCDGVVRVITEVDDLAGGTRVSTVFVTVDDLGEVLHGATGCVLVNAAKLAALLDAKPGSSAEVDALLHARAVLAGVS
jgi:hypothetical protein